MTGRTNAAVSYIAKPKLVPLKRVSWTQSMSAGGTYYHNETFADLIPGELYIISYTLGTTNNFINSYMYPLGETGTVQDESPRLFSTGDAFCNTFRATDNTATMRFQYYRNTGNGNITVNCNIFRVEKKE